MDLDLLNIGRKFYSFKDFDIVFKNYQKHTLTEFSISDSKTLDSAKRIHFTPRFQNAPPELKYYYIKYTCVYGGCYKTKAIIRNITTKRTKCPALMIIKLAYDGISLEVENFIDCHNHEITKKSKKRSRKVQIIENSEEQPRDPATLQIIQKFEEQFRDPATLQDACLLEPLVILEEESFDVMPPPEKRSRVTMITLKKATEPTPLSENDAREAQVTKESENQPGERPIAPQEPCSGVESISVSEVLASQESEEQSQDMEIALPNAMNKLGSNGPKVPKWTKAIKESENQPGERPIAPQELPCLGVESISVGEVLATQESEEQSQDREIALPDAIVELGSNGLKKALVTVDGATNSKMMVNLVCPHCQKGCKLCLKINPPPQPFKTNASNNNKPTVMNNNNGSFQIEDAKVRELKAQVLSLELDKVVMQKKVKFLYQNLRLMEAQNESLLKALKSANKEKDHMGIASMNGIE